jgi:hypothetical protein
VGAVIVIVPVATEQVGWVNVTVGNAGVTGWALIVTFVPADTHPEEFFAVMVYRPGVTPVKIPVEFVYVIPSLL